MSKNSYGRWIAKTGKHHRPPNKLFTGKTAEEALHKMLLAVNKEAGVITQVDNLSTQPVDVV